MPVAIKSTGGGSVTLTAPSTASDLTLTLPSATGTVATTTGTLTNPTINGFTGDTSVINVGSGQIYKDASGNVGIGTSSPNGKLDVNVGGTGGRFVFTYTGSANYLSSLNTGLTGSQDLAINGNNLYLQSGGSTKAYINTNGQMYTTIDGSSGTYAEYGCRAWVNLANSNTLVGSAGLSSVTKTATGFFTINFGFTMPDTNYCASVFCRNNLSDNFPRATHANANSSKSTTSMSFLTTVTGQSSMIDSPEVGIVFMR
jgi:hypothetical protein